MLVGAKSGKEAIACVVIDGDTLIGEENGGE